MAGYGSHSMRPVPFSSFVQGLWRLDWMNWGYGVFHGVLLCLTSANLQFCDGKHPFWQQLPLSSTIRWVCLAGHAQWSRSISLSISCLTLFFQWCGTGIGVCMARGWAPSLNLIRTWVTVMVCNCRYEQILNAPDANAFSSHSLSHGIFFSVARWNKDP